MPLMGIPTILSPDLLHAMSSAGHGDTIVLADMHFPTSSICKAGPREVRADGHKISPLLEAIIKFFPLDTYVDCPVSVMKVSHTDLRTLSSIPDVWNKYAETLKPIEAPSFKQLDRFEFYEEAKKAFCVVATGETAQYGNIIFQKGVVPVHNH